MRILICDSDVNVTEKLREYVIEYFKLKNIAVPKIAVYNDGKSLLEDSEDRDIVFLDMHMPEIDSVTTIKELKRCNKLIIIFVVTSQYNYLNEAIDLNVFRYFQKPVDKLCLFSSLDDALNLYFSTVVKVFIETKNRVIIVNSSEIVMVETQGHKTYIHTLTQKYETTHSMLHWEKELTLMNFFRSHKSFIVNMDYVSTFDKMCIYLCEGKYTAYLTRRKYTEFKNSFLLYLESK